ncbi:zinc finger C2HC domain-containing protein 1C [Ambystoma mexicanum]|uniref:zinc finger C2HC domain-containing protein 1C n=1 Tax=Ambystoma mexicanum TaxID=8296 RepID=UPI0037E900BD
MAGLQMAPHRDTMPSYEKLVSAKFPSLEQERQVAPAPKHQSRLDLMRSQYHEQLMREKEMKMVNQFNQQQQSALSKARSHSYHHPHSAQSEPQPDFRRQGFLSAGYSNKYNKPDPIIPTTTSNWTAKKSSGVDRAYPLKPVFHKKAVSLNNIVAADETRGQMHRPLVPAAYPNSRASGKAPSHTGISPGGSSFSPGLLELQKRSRSNPGRAEPWQKLEAVGENLEEEIRKKEALLREKLRRTEEELRRIQRQKEQAVQEERKEREGRERRRREKVDVPPPTQLKQGNGFRKPDMVEDSSDDEEEYEDSYMTRSNANSRSEQPWMTSTVTPSYRPSPLVGTYDYEVERLKKERLVASNSKIRSREPPPLSDREPSALSYHSDGSSRHRASHVSKGDYMSPSFREPEHRSENRHHTSSAKQPTAPTRATPQELNDEEDEQPFEAEADSELVPCHLCGRRFRAERLEKHATACSKMQNTKRKVFDSSKARAKGTDLEPYLYRKNRTNAAQEQQIQAKKSMWRQKHESFIRNIRQAREVQQVIAKGGKLSDLPPPPPDENPDYIACPHCSRRFAPKVAERHIPKCETIKSKPRPPPQRRR